MNKKQQKNEAMYELKKKSPGVAVGLSLIITGAGHMYLGKVGFGFLLLFIQLALWLVLMGWVMWIIAPILAYNEAKRYNELLRLELDL